MAASPRACIAGVVLISACPLATFWWDTLRFLLLCLDGSATSEEFSLVVSGVEGGPRLRSHVPSAGFADTMVSRQMLPRGLQGDRLVCDHLLRTSAPMPEAVQFTVPYKGAPLGSSAQLRLLSPKHWRLLLFPKAYCRVCEARLSRLQGTSASWCRICGAIDSPEKVLPSDGVIRIDRSTHQVDADPLCVLKTLLGLGVLDHIERMAFRPGLSDYKCVIERNGEPHAMEPPPPEMHRAIVSVARCIWDQSAHDDLEPVQSRRVVVDNEAEAWTSASFRSSKAGEELAVAFDYVGVPSSDLRPPTSDLL